MQMLANTEELAALRRLRLVSILEGTTLLTLLLVAVPLKHMAGIPVATKIMGPIHGLAFAAYVWMLMNNLAGGDWSRKERLQMMIAAMIPFGAFMNERMLARRQAMLTGAV
jgi:integral membrane protein